MLWRCLVASRTKYLFNQVPHFEVKDDKSKDGKNVQPFRYKICAVATHTGKEIVMSSGEIVGTYTTLIVKTNN